jgi:mannose-1-phosphate guanylyltransferase
VAPARDCGRSVAPRTPSSSSTSLAAGRTLLQATVDRLEPLTGDRVVVVTGAAHADAVRAQLPGLAGDQVLAEPSPRDSMAAIGLAAAVVERQDPQAVIGSFAADHVIPDTAAFESVIREAAEVAREGHLVTIGIEPTSPATGFGYIRAGEALPGFATALRAVEFVEKPDAVRAAQYVASGEFRWNAGMFVVRAATLLDLLAQWHHELAAGVRAIAASPERLDELWPGLTRIAIDHAVAEPAADAGHVVVPAPFTWDDVGDFASLAELLPPVEGEPGLRVLGSVDDVTTIDASGIVAAAGGRRVAVVGIEDVVVIDTPDAVLVTTRSRAQDVKAVVDALKAQGRTDLT